MPPAPTAPAPSTTAPNQGTSPSPVSIPTGPGTPSAHTPAADASFDAAFKDLDDLSTPPTPAPAAEPPKPAKEPPATAPAKPSKEPPKEPPAKPNPLEDDEDDAKSESEASRKPTTNRELRNWAEKQGKLAEEKARIAEEKQKEVDRLSERLKTLESSPRDTGREETAIKERIAVLEKQLTERESELASIRWETSKEYKEKFEQPFTDAATEAYEATAQLFILGTNEEGESVQIRQATPADFAEVYHLPYGAAYGKAKELFGDLATVVMQHYAIVHGLDKKRNKALQDHRASAAEEQKAEVARRATEQEGMKRMWAMANEHVAKKYPKFFAPVDGDTEGNDLLQKGFAMVDPAYVNRESMTMQQLILLDARIRNQAAAFPRMAHKARQLEAKLAELEKELAGFRASQPGDEKRPAGSAPPTGEVKNWETAIDEL